MSTIEEAKTFLNNHPLQRREFVNNELILVLLPTNLKDHTLAVLENNSNPILALYYEGDSPSIDTWRGFEFFALASQGGLCSDLQRQYDNLCSLSQQNQRHILTNKEEINLDNAPHKFISDLLNAVLIYARPLRHYGCSFYLPIHYNEPLEPKPSFHNVAIKRRTYDENSLPEQAQAYFYFQPPVRDYLFNTGDNPEKLTPIKEWYLDFDKQKPAWQLNLDKENEAAISSHITGVTLYQYFNHLCMLVIEVKPAAVTELAGSSLFPNDEYKDGEKWWHDLAFSDVTTWQAIRDLQLAHWLRFTKLARILFPTFVEQNKEKKISKVTLKWSETEEIGAPNAASDSLKIESIDKHFSVVMKDFLSGFFPESSPYFHSHYHQVYDDRLFVNVAYGYAGNKMPKTDADKLFSVALYVDEASDTWSAFNGYAYDPDFMRPLLERDAYNRWQNIGTYSGYSNYSNVYLGRGNDFCNIIADKNVPYIYGKMLLITLFYQASLRLYNRQIMKFTDELQQDTNQKQLGEIQTLRLDFIRFTNVYWFHDLSSQQQGQEIFKKQQNALDLKREYEMLKDEMERLDEFLQSRFNGTVTEQATELNNILFLFAVVTVFLAAVQLGISQLDKSWVHVGAIIAGIIAAIIGVGSFIVGLKNIRRFWQAIKKLTNNK